MADRIESNGSFYVVKGGFRYTGLPPADIDQVVTFDYEKNEVTSTDLSKLQGNACVSQYTSSAPSKRPRGAELQIGDFWTDKESKILRIWDGEGWVAVKAINGTPVGTIIQNISVLPPSGYLDCNGLPCPPQYTELTNLLLATTGDILLPNIAGSFIKH